ncbi:MAG: hypothetical protein ACK5Q1_09230 [Limnobacter sp.]
MIRIAGGSDCFPELAYKAWVKNRIIADSAEIIRLWHTRQRRKYL